MRDTRVKFFRVDKIDWPDCWDVIEPPLGTEHRCAPGREQWQPTPDSWKPVLGSPVSRRSARKLVKRLLAHHKGPGNFFLVVFVEVQLLAGKGWVNGVQLAFLKSEDDGEGRPDDLLRLSNTRAPLWFSSMSERPPPPPPNRWDLLMGQDLW